MVEMRRTLFLRDLRPCSLNLLGGELVPRYFFHLRCEDSTVPDPTGADLRDPDYAFEAARSMACNLMSVWMRDVLGVSDHLKGFGQAAGIERRVVTAIGAVGGRAQ